MSYKTIQDLNNEIHNQLASRMSPDFVLLDTPDHINIGDQMIWQGEMDFFESVGISPSYISSHPHFDWRSFSKDTLILLHGGGNFGDVWKGPNEFRLKAVKKYQNNRIIVLPQSVQYNNKSLLERDSAIYGAHKNLTICARDTYSYELLKKHFKNEILLVPDMAFSSSYTNPNSREKATKKLLMKRIDRENKSNMNYNDLKEFETLDWPTCEISLKNYLWRGVEKLNREFAKYFVSKNKIDTTFGLGVKRDRSYYIKMGTSFMAQYSFVASTRLHGHILALHLGIPSVIIDNNYGKNSRFYDTWLKDIPSSTLAINTEELNTALKNIY